MGEWLRDHPDAGLTLMSGVIGVALFVVRMMVRADLAKATAEILDKIEGTYAREDSVALRFDAVHRRIDEHMSGAKK